ncbi:hypothetical protein AYI70_g346 [Smittium culicis]|uniref:Uncharacterized protein n=1 Tax=Smittium culicis TaxID=133412 RepID=A0A1R1YHD0_9FUNG|nr:hypothetical protein AYI70_g346 [Smittium culicis]
MESDDIFRPYQFERISDSILRAKASEFYRTKNSELLNSTERIWNHFLGTNTGPNVAYVPNTLNPADASNRLAAQTECQTGVPKHNTGHSVMENSNIVPGSSENLGRTNASSTSDNGDTRSRKRKISAIQQQGVVLDGLVDQRRFLKAQGFTDSAINIIVSNQHSAKRRSS